MYIPEIKIVGTVKPKEPIIGQEIADLLEEIASGNFEL